MTATILQFPKPKPKRKVFGTRPATEIQAQFSDTAPSEMIPYGGAGIDGMPYWEPDEDPA